MKLLFLTVIPAPYQRELFKAIEETGEVDLTVMYYRAGAHDRHWGQAELYEFERVLPGRTFTQLGPSAHWNPSAMKEIEKLNPDLTVVSDYSSVTAQVVMRGLAKRKMPFVYWGEMPGFTKRGFIGTMARRALQAPLSKSEAIAAIGKLGVESYQRIFPKAEVFNIPYFCELTRYQEARSACSKDDESINVLFSGQMIERKGLATLLNAFDLIGREFPKLKLMILGDGPKKAEYEALVADELKNQVDFMGHQDPKDLPKIFAQADVFCLPSRHDGWGVVVNEALGAGLPILISDKVGAGPDLVQNGGNGYITPVDDVDALASALKKLAENPELRAKMSAKSAEIATNSGVDEGARLWVAAANMVLSKLK